MGKTRHFNKLLIMQFLIIFYIGVNPFGHIPSLKIKGMNLFETFAIMRYLESLPDLPCPLRPSLFLSSILNDQLVSIAGILPPFCFLFFPAFLRPSFLSVSIPNDQVVSIAGTPPPAPPPHPSLLYAMLFDFLAPAFCCVFVFCLLSIVFCFLFFSSLQSKSYFFYLADYVFRTIEFSCVKPRIAKEKENLPADVIEKELLPGKVFRK